MECRAAGLPVSTSTVDSSEELQVEEPQQLDLDVVYNRLEQMKLRAKELRKLLVKERPMTAEFAKCLDKIEKQGSSNKEVRAVQLQTMHLVRQVSTLARQLKNEGNQASEQQNNLQNNRSQINELYSRVETLQKWPEKVKHQTGKCLERYNDLNITCMDLEQLSQFIKQAYEYFPNAIKNKAPMSCYQVDYRTVVKRLETSWQIMHASFKLLLKTSGELKVALEKRNRLEYFSTEARSISNSVCQPTESILFSLLSGHPYFIDPQSDDDDESN